MVVAILVVVNSPIATSAASFDASTSARTFATEKPHDEGIAWARTPFYGDPTEANEVPR